MLSPNTGSVPPAPIIISTLAKAYHSNSVLTGKLCPLLLQKTRHKSTSCLQTEDTEPGVQQFLQKASCAKEGQQQHLMKSKEKSFAGQRMTSLFGEE